MIYLILVAKARAFTLVEVETEDTFIWQEKNLD